MKYCFLVTSKKPDRLIDNCLKSLYLCGIDLRDIYLYSDEYEHYAKLAPNINHIPIQKLPVYSVMNNSGYFGYGEGEFNLFTALKFLVLIDMIKNEVSPVVFIDCDIAFKLDPSAIFERILSDYNFLFQLESYSQYPPTACTGIIGIANNQYTKKLLKNIFINLLIINSQGGNLCDQDIVNYYLQNDKVFAKNSFYLPQVNFPVGKLSHAYECTQISEINAELKAPAPICFHANHVSGIENKLELLRASGFYYINN